MAVTTSFSFALIADCEALPVASLPIGCRAWVQEANTGDGAFYTYEASSAVVDHTTVLSVNGIGDARWIVDTAVPAAGSITNAMLANAPAHTVKGNQTGSSATPTDVNLFLDSWVTSGQAAGLALGCTEFVTLPTMANGTIGTAIVDSITDGGGFAKTNGGPFLFPTTSLLENMKTSAIWYCKLRFKQSAISSTSQYSQIGLMSATGAGWRLTDQNGVHTGNWYLDVYNGSTTPNADTGVAVDTSWHDLEVYHSSTNIIAKLDGVQVATLADTQLGDSPASFGIIISAGITTTIRKGMVGFVGA